MNRRRLFRIALLLLAAGIVLLLVGAATTVLLLPDVEPLASERPGTTAFIEQYLDAHPARDLRWTWSPYDSISPHLKRAVLVSEDINFFAHDGFDTHEIEQAVKIAWERKEFPRGASTITQQLARNLYLSPSRTAWRKLAEAVLTWRLEQQLGKRRILEIYLNVVEFGPGIYGAEAASRHYFGIAASQLDETQAARLAAVLPRPSVWHPGRETRGYLAAVERILRRMDKAQFLWRVI